MFLQSTKMSLRLSEYGLNQMQCGSSHGGKSFTAGAISLILAGHDDAVFYNFLLVVVNFTGSYRSTASI